MTVSQSFLLFHDLDSFEGSVVCRIYLNLDVFGNFLIIPLGLLLWGENITEVKSLLITCYT